MCVWLDAKSVTGRRDSVVDRKEGLVRYADIIETLQAYWCGNAASRRYPSDTRWL